MHVLIVQPDFLDALVARFGGGLPPNEARRQALGFFLDPASIGALLGLVLGGAPVQGVSTKEDSRILLAVGGVLVPAAQLPIWAATLAQLVDLTSSRARLAPTSNYDAPADDPSPWHLALTQVRTLSGDGEGALLGVLDSRIDPACTEFAGRLAACVEVQSATLQIIGQAPATNSSHATGIAGIAVGSTVGVAPTAAVISCAALTDSDPSGMAEGSLDQVLVALNYLVCSGVTVVNISLQVDDAGRKLASAIRNVAALRPVTIIAAAGNWRDGFVAGTCTPGDDPHVISVGATDRLDQVPDWSVWGEHHGRHVPDLYAPGSFVRAPSLQNHWGYQRGTSVAAAVVSGLVLRLVSGQHATTVPEIRELVLGYAVERTTYGGNGARPVNRLRV